MDDDKVYGDTDVSNVSDTSAGQATTAGDDLPGYPVDGLPSWRAGVFGAGNGVLGMAKASDFTAQPDAAPPRTPSDGDAVLMLTANRSGGAAAPGDDPPWTHSPLTFCPVPGHTQLLQQNLTTGQGDGRFGPTRNGGARMHWGVDYDAPVGTPVAAAGDGVVVDIRPNPSSTYGHQVVIDHGGGVYTQSAHLSRVDVKPGDQVAAGQVVGLSGHSGNAEGLGRPTPQVHFEVRKGSPLPRLGGGQPEDPPPWCFQ